MWRQTSSIAEPHSTAGASVELVGQVWLEVKAHCLLECCSLATDEALEWLLTDPMLTCQVHRQNGLLLQLLAADVALEWLLSGNSLAPNWFWNAMQHLTKCLLNQVMSLGSSLRMLLFRLLTHCSLASGPLSFDFQHSCDLPQTTLTSQWLVEDLIVNFSSNWLLDFSLFGFQPVFSSELWFLTTVCLKLPLLYSCSLQQCYRTQQSRLGLIKD